MAPIPEMDTIWMDGALVPWADAKVHVLTHALHYGSGVFEGIRAYKTERGVAVLRLTEHLKRIERSAKLYYMPVPYSGRRALRRHLRGARVQQARGLLHPPAGLPRLRRDGPVPHGRSRAGHHRRLALGHVPRRRGHQARRARQDEQHPVARPHRAGPRRQGHRPVPEQHPRQDRGAQRRLRRGRDAHGARPRRRGLRREHLLRAQRRADDAAAERRRARGHHPRHHHARWRPARASSCRSAACRAATWSSPTSCSTPAPPPRSCRSARSTTTSSASPAR